jgi:hypothetical protein
MAISEASHRKLELIHRFPTNPQRLHRSLLYTFALGSLKCPSGLFRWVF